MGQFSREPCHRRFASAENTLAALRGGQGWFFITYRPNWNVGQFGQENRKVVFPIMIGSSFQLSPPSRLYSAISMNCTFISVDVPQNAPVGRTEAGKLL